MLNIALLSLNVTLTAVYFTELKKTQDREKRLEAKEKKLDELIARLAPSST